MENQKKLSDRAYKLSVIRSVIALIIISLCKLPPEESEMIKMLLTGRLSFNWLYMVFPERVISFLIAILGIAFGMRLLTSLKRTALGRIVGITGL